eukprot:5578700-Amphidinium_carterae.1
MSIGCLNKLIEEVLDVFCTALTVQQQQQQGADQGEPQGFQHDAGVNVTTSRLPFKVVKLLGEYGSHA